MYIILKCILDYMKRYDALYSIQIIAMNTSLTTMSKKWDNRKQYASNFNKDFTP